MPRRRLRPDEMDLWRRVTSLVSPIDRTRPGVAPEGAGVPADPEPNPQPTVPRPSPERQAPRSDAPRKAAGPARIDGRLKRGLSRGKLRPEASLDLHGMTLAQAHGTLSRFILSSHGSGLRLVLIITGKGRGGAGEPLWDQDRGALRRQVPLWLGAPPLAAVVRGVMDAHRNHGGNGALYVSLKRN